MRRSRWILLAGLGVAFAAAAAPAQSPTGADPVASYYRIEAVPGPSGLDPQVGGLDFMPDGRLAVSFHSGEVFTYHPPTREWALFADGLHEPLGVLAAGTDRLVVVQKPEVTRITDTDGDGRGDHYATVSDAFGFTGNYHEFAFGPVRDAQGNLYISLNTASTGAGILDEVRGEFRSLSATREEVRRGDFPNKMFAVAPYRGWVLKITPDGETVPFASGFRSPNGLLLDRSGRLFVTDNQGDWVGTSRMYHVEEGKFYGHPASLAWQEGWSRDPFSLDPGELDRLRTREIIAFPHELMANSPSQPVVAPPSFGPFAGQILIGEMDRPRILRVMLEEVGGALQGAVTPLIDGLALGAGNNRMAVAPDGALWVGKTHLKWVGGTGLRRIIPTGEVPMEVRAMTAAPGGFEIAFTHPVDVEVASDPRSYAFRRYHYSYHRKYGSPPVDLARVEVSRVQVLDRERVRVEIADLRPGYLYELDLSRFRSADGRKVLNPLVVYTLNRLVDGTEPPPGFDVAGAGGGVGGEREVRR